jgi:hypothetical protein
LDGIRAPAGAIIARRYRRVGTDHGRGKIHGAELRVAPIAVLLVPVY